MRRPAAATALVRAAFDALLAREPEPSALVAQLEFLANGGALRDLLAAIDQAPEHWSRQVQVHAESVVQLVFEALLGRQADPEAAASYAAAIRAGRDIRDFINEVGTSREHRAKLLRSLEAKLC